jgi:hypothetical protein
MAVLEEGEADALIEFTKELFVRERKENVLKG